jgi:hypothetical protein
MAIDWKHLATQLVLADGTIDENEVKILSRALKDSGEEGLDYLIELRSTYAKKAKAKGEAMSDAFENFFFKTIQGHVLQDGGVSAGGAAVLGKVFPGGKVDDKGYEWLTGTLGKKAKTKDPAFEEFLKGVEDKRAKAAKSKA